MTAPADASIPQIKAGPPLKDVDANVVQAMASVGATNVEIAEYCGVDEKTIRNRFSEVLTKARSVMRVRLRQAQYRLALKGNVGMLVWLGKNMLNQMEPSQRMDHVVHGVVDHGIQIIERDELPATDRGDDDGAPAPAAGTALVTLTAPALAASKSLDPEA